MLTNTELWVIFPRWPPIGFKTCSSHHQQWITLSSPIFQISGVITHSSHTSGCLPKRYIPFPTISQSQHGSWKPRTVPRDSLARLCCDICAVKCECGLPECETGAAFPGEVTKSKPSPALRSRKVSDQQKELNIYHKQLATKLMGTTPNSDIKILTDISCYWLLWYSNASSSS